MMNCLNKTSDADTFQPYSIKWLDIQIDYLWGYSYLYYSNNLECSQLETEGKGVHWGKLISN